MIIVLYCREREERYANNTPGVKSSYRYVRTVGVISGAHRLVMERNGNMLIEIYTLYASFVRIDT